MNFLIKGLLWINLVERLKYRLKTRIKKSNKIPKIDIPIFSDELENIATYGI